MDNQIIFSYELDLVPGYYCIHTTCCIQRGMSVDWGTEIGTKIKDVSLPDFLFIGSGKGYLNAFRNFSNIWESKKWN